MMCKIVTAFFLIGAASGLWVTQGKSAYAIGEPSLSSMMLETQTPRHVAFSRTSKTGGTTLQMLLREVLPDIHIIPEGVNDNSGLERATINRNETFLISSVRNPCEWYVSWWSMLGQLIFKEGKPACMEGIREHPYCGQEGFRKCVVSFFPDNIDIHNFSNEEATAFQHWVTSPQGWAGRVSKNFADKHGKSFTPWDFCDNSFRDHYDNLPSRDWTVESVDCWIRTENLEDDVHRCVDLYAKSGGTVNWDKLPKQISKVYSRRDDRLCSKFFDQKTAEFVMKHDKLLFEQFGYSKCCVA